MVMAQDMGWESRWQDTRQDLVAKNLVGHMKRDGAMKGRGLGAVKRKAGKRKRMGCEEGRILRQPPRSPFPLGSTPHIILGL